jgi:hypothetical protein
MAIDRLPKDPMLLLSFVNTRLRDDRLTLDEFSAQFGVESSEIEGKLDSIGYKYDGKKFI